MKAIINGIILTPHEEIHGMALQFDTVFRGIVPLDQVQADEMIDAKGRYIAPGLIDVHILAQIAMNMHINQTGGNISALSVNYFIRLY